MILILPIPRTPCHIAALNGSSGPVVPPRGTQELFTKVGNDPKLELNGCLQVLFGSAPLL